MLSGHRSNTKLIYFKSIFMAYFSKFMIHFNVELWNIHQLFVLQVLNEKEIIPTRKAEKLARVEFFVATEFQNVTIESQYNQQKLCRNKDQAE